MVNSGSPASTSVGSTAQGGNHDVWVVVPLFNEAAVIAGVVRALRASFPNVLCVDDGSEDESGRRAREAGAQVVTHPINLGQGAALQTGFEFALLDPRASWVITFDADGQHRVQDADALLSHARRHDLGAVFGSRFMGVNSDLDLLKRLVLKTAVGYTNLSTGTKLSDAHNGLRVLRRDVVHQVDLTQNRMAHASQLVSQVGRSGVPYGEHPVEVLYTEYSRAKGQSMWNAVNILAELWSR